MKDTFILEHAEQYKELLNKVEMHDKSVNESVMQNYLEMHTAFMPMPFRLNHQLHFNSFISKFPVGPWVTDVAYLTKSTAEWWLVLMELENPHKRLFKGNLDHADFTSDYMQAKQQIEDWKNWIEDNRNEVLNSLHRIMVPIQMQKNRVSFKYVLIMGRRSELIQSEARRRAIASANGADFRIITYDTILSDYERIRRVPVESIVLSLYNGDRFKVKTLPLGKDGKNRLDGTYSRIETHLFSYLGPEDISLSADQIKNLENDDYEMQSWLKGELLKINTKYTSQGYAKRFSDDWLANALMTLTD